MSTGDQVHPEADAWIVAVHASPDDYEPRGSGIVLDDRRILTCSHVVENLQEVWVDFPKSEEDSDTRRRRVERLVLPAASAPVKDLAILVLSESVPTAVTAAPLRCPKPADLVGIRWWAFGFPSGDPVGSAADGQIGGALAHGWVRLDRTSRYPVERGFSGGGLWSPDYQAVVAVVSHAKGSQGDGRAITIHQADLWFPDQKLRPLAERYSAADAGEVALAAWGWSLSGDPEGVRHWGPRSRGVSINSEQGYRFRGRSAALRAITGWLGHDVPTRRVMVVTGAPGAGKSAVLGRIVTTADGGAAAELPASDTAVRAAPGSVACAVHAKGLTALEIAIKIATAASAAIPERVEDFAPAIRDALTERATARFNLIVDALDEAVSPTEARLTVSKVIVPLAETCADVGARVVAGSRRSDAGGELLAAFGGAAQLVDLDKPEYFDQSDLAAYVHATLQLAGDERAGNPYADDAVAGPIAERIAAQSDGNFLVAGLTARTHGLYDAAPIAPESLAFSPKVDDAMREYLRRVPPAGGVSAEALLAALAYAESPGLPAGLWRSAVRALGFGDVPEPVLRRFARSSAASFLVESSGEGGVGAEFRLFHQALNDALLHSRTAIARPNEDQEALTREFMGIGQQTGWDHAPTYLLRSLPGHAARAGLLDDLLTDDSYLLYADLLRVQPLAGLATTERGRQRERLIRLSPRNVISADAPTRAAMFSVTEALEDLPGAYTQAKIRAPYRQAWAAAPPSTEVSTLRGHIGEVTAICVLTLAGTTLLASGGFDWTVRIWDPSTGTELQTLRGHDSQITAICAFPLNDTTYLATGDSEGKILIWDPAAGVLLRLPLADRVNGGINAICAFPISGTTYLATTTHDGTIQIWDPLDGTQCDILPGYEYQCRGSTAICAFSLNGTSYLATVSSDGTVQMWDPSDATQQDIVPCSGYDSGSATAICAFPFDGSTYLATTTNDGNIQICNPADGTQRHRLAESEYGDVDAICAFPLNGSTYLATTTNDGTVQVWDPSDSTQRQILTGHGDGYGKATAICAFPLNGTTYLAITDDDGTIRIWDPSDATQRSTLTGHEYGGISSICTLTLDGTTHLATLSGARAVQIWDPADGTRRDIFTGHNSVISAICAFPLNGAIWFATGDDDEGIIQIWDSSSTRRRTLTRHDGPVTAICALTLNGAVHLAIGYDDGTIQIWDPTTGTRRCTLTGSNRSVTAICSLTLTGTTHLAAINKDWTISIWDPITGTRRRTFSGHEYGRVSAICTLALNGTTHLASSVGALVRIWDPANGTRRRTLAGHTDWVTAMCELTLNGATYLVTTSEDGTARIWDPATGTSMLTVPTRDAALSVAHAEELLFVGTRAGLLAIRLDPDYLSHSAR